MNLEALERARAAVAGGRLAPDVKAAVEAKLAEADSNIADLELVRQRRLQAGIDARAKHDEVERLAAELDAELSAEKRA